MAGKARRPSVVGVESHTDSGYPPVRLHVLTRDTWRCRVPTCRSGTAVEVVEVDHVVPRSQQGPHHEDNLITLCRTHHRLKHDGLLVVFSDGGGMFRIFDLRQMVLCEGCSGRIDRGQAVVTITPSGARRVVPIGG